jgi:hypothetical protein
VYKHFESCQDPLLVNILLHWGKEWFPLRPKVKVYFVVVLPWLIVLRQWIYPLCPVVLVKVKSHTGCLMNGVTYKPAKKGYSNDEKDFLWPSETCIYIYLGVQQQRDQC